MIGSFLHQPTLICRSFTVAPVVAPVVARARLQTSPLQPLRSEEAGHPQCCHASPRSSGGNWPGGCSAPCVAQHLSCRGTVDDAHRDSPDKICRAHFPLPKWHGKTNTFMDSQKLIKQSTGFSCSQRLPSHSES